MTQRWVAASIILLGSAVAASAQSLAEIAKKEQERRKSLQKPSRVITNEQVKKYAPPPPAPPAPEPSATPATAESTPVSPLEAPSPVAPSPAGAVAPAPKPASAPAAAPPVANTDPAKEEKYWRERIANARALVERTQVLADAMQSRINALTMDFVARDDPAQRALLGQDRDRALLELARLKAEAQKFTQTVTDIEEEARRAGVPPGWLR